MKVAFRRFGDSYPLSGRNAGRGEILSPSFFLPVQKPAVRVETEPAAAPVKNCKSQQDIHHCEKVDKKTFHDAPPFYQILP